MANDVAPREGAAAVETAANAVNTLAPEAQQVAMEAVASRISPPRRKTADVLWLVLVGGLVLMALAALGGVIALEADNKATTDPDKLLTIFTAVLTGLIGLFVSSPLDSGGGSGT